MKKPVYRNEIRAAITESTKGVKNSFILKRLLQLSEIYRHYWDDKLHESVSEDDVYRMCLIDAIMSDDPDLNLKQLHIFVRSMRMKKIPYASKQ